MAMKTWSGNGWVKWGGGEGTAGQQQREARRRAKAGESGRKAVRHRVSWFLVGCCEGAGAGEGRAAAPGILESARPPGYRELSR